MIRIVRQERLDDVKRSRLMEAAIAEFTERRFTAASYNRIIERSGLSKGTVYYYFDNREALLHTLLEEVCGRFLEAVGGMELPEKKEDFWTTAWAYHGRAIRFFFENPSLTRIMFMMGREDRCDAHLLDLRRKSVAFMAKLLQRGQETGTVRDDLSLKTLLQILEAIGDVLNSAILGELESADPGDDAAMQERVQKFMFMMHDLSVRVLSPGEVQDVRQLFQKI